MAEEGGVTRVLIPLLILGGVAAALTLGAMTQGLGDRLSALPGPPWKVLAAPDPPNGWLYVATFRSVAEANAFAALVSPIDMMGQASVSTPAEARANNDLDMSPAPAWVTWWPTIDESYIGPMTAIYKYWPAAGLP